MTEENEEQEEQAAKSLLMRPQTADEARRMAEKLRLVRQGAVEQIPSADVPTIVPSIPWWAFWRRWS